MRMAIKWTVLGCVMTLLGCAAKVPVEPIHQKWLKDGYIGNETQKNMTLDGHSWRSIWSDSALEVLLAKAKVANYDARIAMMRLEQARAGWRQMATRKIPKIEIEGSASEESTSLPAPVKQGNPDVRAYRIGVSASWELDLWGAVDAATKASEFDARAAEAGAETARWLAQHEVVRAYLIWQGARMRLEVMERIAEADRQVINIVNRRFQEGIASAFDVAGRSAQREQTEAEIPQLKTLIDVTVNQLAMMVGEKPGDIDDVLDRAQKSLPFSDEIPVGLPIDLLKRRPDLIVAEHQLMAETQRLRMSQADLWPKFFLAAGIGQQELRLNSLELSPARFSNVALAFVYPLFDSGRLKAAVNQQTAKQRQATLSYEKAVLQALTDVENSLVALRQEKNTLNKRQAALDFRRQALQHGESMHKEGLIDPIDRVNLNKAYQAAQLSYTESRLSVALATLQLYKGLGGGWEAHTAQSTTDTFGEQHNLSYKK